ncbi:hypothetical protein K4L44_14410 [Halosquirtibacter laminarini]|uniref:Uncharacterized protein n=1 Tax=Halosquirtibacter laminarini TaxID=3374600 RepID=A0AC61NK02_9BACT|nr:hypothetical protein K4L44_14410 [Prolixibacteraceae bacterium]
MNKLFVYCIGLILMSLAFVQCSPIAGLQKKYDTSFVSGDYGASLTYAESLIEAQGKDGGEVPVQTYLMAGRAASHSADMEKAKKFYEIAYSLGANNPEMLFDLSQIYKKEDQMSREMRVLNDLMKHSDSQYAKEKSERYFFLNVEAELYEKADSMWTSLPETFKSDGRALNAYLKVCTSLKKEKKSVAVAKTILQSDPNSYDAKKIMAMDAYNRAESHYSRVMNAYNKNKTRRNYAILLKELKKSGKNYNYALTKLKSVYKVKKEKSIALYISNVYARINNKRLSNYYRSLSRK